ncbi:MAG: hypothetical protein EPO40_07780 [Myxococcaceae bacterium]|nr:MAG: hypothetical protein EPO40_07780 [Myxococcaceae bacterium]
MKRLLVPAFATFGLALTACGDVSPNDLRDPTCSATTFNVEGRTFTTFGTTADARKIDAFLQATLDLNAATIEIADGLTTTCAAIGTDLGLAASEYRPATAGELPVAYTCRRVSQEVRTIIEAALPRGASLDVTIVPPVCQIDVSFAARCAAQCTATATVEVPRCMGELVAECTGSCSGSCAGTCDGGCTGVCSGMCTGTCMGTCVGQCSAGCSATDSTGRCVGTCAGTCNGSCSATCTGSCTGSCSAGCQGSCRGQCRGTCSVQSSVRCDGTYDVQADAQCSAACEAQANARATCTDPQITIGSRATVSPAALQRLNVLVTSLQRHYPRIVLNATRIDRVVRQSAPNFVASLNGVGTAASNVGLSAVACVARAGVVATDIASRFSASAQVSVEFSASVSVQGTAQ